MRDCINLYQETRWMKSAVTPLRVCVSVPAALISPHYVSLHSGVLRCVSTYLQRETFNSGSMGNPRGLMNNNKAHHCIGGEGHCPSASIPQISVTMYTVHLVPSFDSAQFFSSILYWHYHIHLQYCQSISYFLFYFWSFFFFCLAKLLNMHQRPCETTLTKPSSLRSTIL